MVTMAFPRVGCSRLVLIFVLVATVGEEGWRWEGSGLQLPMSELAVERQESESRVAVLEEKVMAEAEALNEAQLAAMED